MDTNELTIGEVNESISLKSFKIDVDITASSRKDTVLNAIDNLCENMAVLGAAAESIRIALGKLMLMVQERELYRPEHETFESYRMAMAEKYRLSRASINRTLGIARALPMLDAAAAEKIPESNLYMLSRAVANNNIDAPSVKTLLKSAAKLPLREFRAVLEKEGWVPRKHLPDPGIVIIRATARLAEYWTDFVNGADPAIVLADLIGYKQPAKRGRRPKVKTASAA